MRPVGLYSALTFSVSLHALIIASTLLIARQMSLERPAAPYIVSLVQDTATVAPNAGVPDKTGPAVPETKAEERVKQPEAAKTKAARNTVKEPNRAEDAIAALEAKSRIEKMVGLRRMINVGGVGEGRKTLPAKVAGGPSSGKPPAAISKEDYNSLVGGMIRQEWIYPETLDRDLEAVITIKLAADGTFSITGIEKKSGSTLFDRSVISAIRKIARFPQPPKGAEGEIVLRFRP